MYGACKDRVLSDGVCQGGVLSDGGLSGWVFLSDGVFQGGVLSWIQVNQSYMFLHYKAK